jgi:transketolase
MLQKLFHVNICVRDMERSIRFYQDLGLRYVGEQGQSLGIHFFGASAPLKSLQKKFGFTPEHIIEAAKDQLRQAAK